MIKRIRAWILRKGLDSPQKKKLNSLEELLGLPILRPALYLKALRHRSQVAEMDLAPTESYEQLEFIGDAVLDLVLSDIIFKKYPHASEGMLTQLRSRLVKGEMLAKIAREIHLMEYIELGQRVKNQGVETSQSVLSDAFEALVGALYMDHGYSDAFDFISGLYEKYVVFDDLIEARDNYKSILLEQAQSRKLQAPVYRTVRESGPGHDKFFEVEVRVNDDISGRGSGKSKKKAEQAAAESALKKLGCP